jgi:hypothetical protein
MSGNRLEPRRAVCSLTTVPRTFDDVFVRRVICFVLAIVVALWFPVRSAGAGQRETSSPRADGSARTEQPSHAADFAPQMMAAPAGGWQARFASDVFASQSSTLTRPDYSLSASVSPARLRLHIPHPVRTFPLLI